MKFLNRKDSGSHGFSLPIVTVVGFLTILLGGLFYLYVVWSKSQIPDMLNNQNTMAPLVKFNDPHYSFSFKYPKNWFMQKLDSPGIYDTVEVSNYPNSCNNCTDSEKASYIEFYIQKNETLPNNTTYKTAKEYIIAKEQQFNIEERKKQIEYKKKTGKDMIPMTPGFTQRFIREPDMIHLVGVSTAEVSFYNYTPDLLGHYLSNKEYVLLVNNRNVYTIDLIKPKVISSESQHILNQITESLKFK